MLINIWIKESYPSLNKSLLEALELKLKKQVIDIKKISFRRNGTSASFIYNENDENIKEEKLITFDLKEFPVKLKY